MNQETDARTGDTFCFRSQGLTKVYGRGHGAVHALRGVDLELPERELIVLLGASGSGKSTLLNILGGLDQPTDGRVFFRSTELTAASHRTAQILSGIDAGEPVVLYPGEQISDDARVEPRDAAS